MEIILAKTKLLDCRKRLLPENPSQDFLGDTRSNQFGFTKSCTCKNRLQYLLPRGSKDSLFKNFVHVNAIIQKKLPIPTRRKHCYINIPQKKYSKYQ